MLSKLAFCAAEEKRGGPCVPSMRILDPVPPSLSASEFGGPSVRRNLGQMLKTTVSQTSILDSKAPLDFVMSNREKLGSMSPTAEKLDLTDTVSSIPPIETSVPVLCEFPDDTEEDYPEGGRGWIVVAGCFLQATVTLGEIAHRCLRPIIHCVPQAIHWLGEFSSSITKTTFFPMPMRCEP